MEALVGHEPLDVEALDRLLPLLSLDAYEVLLNTLVTSKDRSVRRMLLDRLGQTALDAAPLIAARLHDERWYVVRNMLVLLQRLRRFPPGFSALHWAEHSDVRVRVEAIQLALLIRAEHDVALRRALSETDVRMLRLGLTAVQQDCPRALTPLVISQAVDAKAADDVRVLATRTLGRTRDLRARDALLQLVDGGRTLLGRPKLAPTTTVTIAAIRSLADGWSHDPAAAPIIQLAAASADPELRQAANGAGQ
jgi:hypothetical protein